MEPAILRSILSKVEANHMAIELLIIRPGDGAQSMGDNRRLPRLS